MSFSEGVSAFSQQSQPLPIPIPPPPPPQQQQQQQSSRKSAVVSANHLLNFQLPPRQQHHFNHSGNRSSGKNNYSTFNHQSTVYNKERFVNANFRFILSPSGDYTNLVLDPDALVDWQWIEQVIIATVDFQSCPICLSSPPAAAKVGKCGHVFCYACILHYLALSTTKWAKCPICFDSVYQKDLRSVRYQIIRDFSKLKAENSSQSNLAASSGGSNSNLLVTSTQQNQSNAYTSTNGDRIVMRLMQRSSGSMTVLPRPFWSEWAMTGSPCCESLDSIYLSFAKSIIGSPQFIQQTVLNGEQAELEQSLQEARQLGDQEEAIYLEMALTELAERREEFNRHLVALNQAYLQKKGSQKVPVIIASSPLQLLSCSLSDQSTAVAATVDRDIVPVTPLLLTPPALPMEDPFSDLIMKNNAVNHLQIAPSRDAAGCDKTAIISKSPIAFDSLPNSFKESARISGSPAAAPPTNSIVNGKAAQDCSGGMYYFYQAADGQPLYLHPLEIKILKSEYGSYERFPDEICVRLSAITESTLTEDARKRYKYLAHLPLSCDVIFAEIDWQAPIGVNICRQLVTRSTAASPLASPSTFTIISGDNARSLPAGSDSSNTTSTVTAVTSLVSADTLRRYDAELRARSKRRSSKLRKEEKEQARLRRNSLGTINGGISCLTTGGLHSPSQSLQQQRLRNSAEQIFDFDDQRLWAPLPTSATAVTGAPAPPALPQHQQQSAIIAAHSPWNSVVPIQSSMFPALASSAMISPTSLSRQQPTSPVSFAQALGRRDQEILIFGSPVSLPAIATDNVNSNSNINHSDPSTAAKVISGTEQQPQQPPAGEEDQPGSAGSQKKKNRRPKQIMLLSTGTGGRRAY